MWIANAIYPGGFAYLAVNASDWYQTTGIISSVVLQLISDGLLVSKFLDSLWRRERTWFDRYTDIWLSGGTRESPFSSTSWDLQTATSLSKFLPIVV